MPPPPPETWRDRIALLPDVHHGEPTIRGTRISVATVVASLADLGLDRLLADFPQLTPDDVRAALD